MNFVLCCVICGLFRRHCQATNDSNSVGFTLNMNFGQCCFLRKFNYVRARAFQIEIPLTFTNKVCARITHLRQQMSAQIGKYVLIVNSEWFNPFKLNRVLQCTSFALTIHLCAPFLRCVLSAIVVRTCACCSCSIPALPYVQFG